MDHTSKWTTSSIQAKVSRDRISIEIKHKMKSAIRLKRILLITVTSTLISLNSFLLANPIAYDPTAAPMISYPPMPLQAPMLMAPQFDPYASMQMPHYMFNPQHHYMPMQVPFDASPDRRSNFNGRLSNNQKGNSDQGSDMSDEQKALAGVPSSLVSREGKFLSI